ncbi:MAG TPA: undecaprenyldiphospho-muramoylpentapeptide beta-N-acetylglucosaminyltransferase [Thermoanaerobaculia bacterium]|nr:undecaprenyldiphospho-muramoylpentapeptide beta-N-acetylglucosaminyltransferase [Thermoanaerobaculia bacterium]
MTKRVGVMGVKTLMIAGGGTGGHIYPAIAIAREYASRDASRRVVFVGTEKGLEKNIVPKAGFPLEFINVGGLKGKGGLDLVRNVFRLPLGFLDAWRVVGRHRPSVVLGVGGYSSGPVLVAARLRGIPTIIHEANAFPGLANRVVARWVTTVAVAFAEALPRMHREDGVVTGNPIRAEFFRVATAAPGRRSPAETAGATQKQRLLIFGGSQGSRILNDNMAGALLFLARLKDTLDIVHQTGPNELAKVQAAYKQSAFPNARVVPYLDPMADEIAAADLVVSRSGAMTVGELSAVGRAAILVPFAAATNNHQELNARVVERAGGAVVITEAELTPEKLARTISDIVSDPARAARMGEASRTLATPDATKKIVDLIERIQTD